MRNRVAAIGLFTLILGPSLASADVTLTDQQIFRLRLQAARTSAATAGTAAQSPQQGPPAVSPDEDDRRPRVFSDPAVGRILTDAIGLQWIVNTNVTYDTSSSASGAVSDAVFKNAVQASTAAGGLQSSMLSDAFDGYNGLFVTVGAVGDVGSGWPAGVRTSYNKLGPATTECGGRQVVFGNQAVGGVTISRKFFVPSNDAFGRWITVLHNPTASAKTVIVETSNNLGSDADTTVVDSSSGDAIASVNDHWITSFKAFTGANSSAPRLGHVIQGPGAKVPVFSIAFGGPTPVLTDERDNRANGAMAAQPNNGLVMDVGDKPTWRYSFDLPAGKTFILLNMATGQPTKAAARAKAIELTALPANALQCLSDDEKSQIKNFVVPGFTPTVTITSPVAPAVTTAASIDLAGTAVDNAPVASVTWTDDHGNAGTATGTTNWTIPGFPLPVGPTTVTVTATDTDGNTGTASILITATASTAGTFVFTAASQAVVENAGPATLTIARTGGSAGSATVSYATANGTALAGSDYVATTGSVSFAAGELAKTITVPITDDAASETTETFTVALTGITGSLATQPTLGSPAVSTVSITDEDRTTYYLPEGATGPFFDLDILIANPNAVAAPVRLTFLKPDGTVVTEDRTLPATSQTRVPVDPRAASADGPATPGIPGLENSALSTVVKSLDGLPLAVESSMFWDGAYYGSHTTSAVENPAMQWHFAEGSQGFFDTYLLLANPNLTAGSVTVTFYVEGGAPVVRTYPIGATSRLNVYTGLIPELVGRSFSMQVDGTVPVLAARAMYFGSPLFNGGGASSGVPAPATSWFLPEGATGSFFSTYVLLGNPNATPATVTLTYLLTSGATVTTVKTVPANARLTVDVAAEAPVLASAEASTTITSDLPIVAERSMFWPGGFPGWFESHNSFGITQTGTKWAVAEGRVGQSRGFETYLLLANPGATAAEVRITFLREGGGTVTKTYTVAPTSRLNIYVNAVPELANETVGALIESTNGVPIAVERSLYSSIPGVPMAAGSNATAVPIP